MLSDILVIIATIGTAIFGVVTFLGMTIITDTERIVQRKDEAGIQYLRRCFLTTWTTIIFGGHDALRELYAWLVRSPRDRNGGADGR